ncbi:fructosamine kinase family protein [Cellulomonas wangsupingiae]|uniref:Fructosamine kinase family protein n=1 Tax=Cellulomonas wangsupingiae TaxID=2968085 RepID=A0ABY5K553_9CELL|nr:fructosamine kinase family protein [Cellulomonas wangsupingiae]MCC2334966.1 fructosamine kinase family protein [Cellulomonas wangsupingiae]UUI65465.1 fructosamine kinase family protein [Cellulomonas wangsupingiae]
MSGTTTDPTSLLLGRLHAAGLTDVVAVEHAAGGQAAVAGLARRADGTSVFAKGFVDAPSDDAFAAEAEGLDALRTLGGATTPDVVIVGPDLLVLEALRPRPDDPAFWEQLAHALAHLHTSTTHPRFGWHRDNWLGRRRQVNTWHDDGFEFFAQHRLLRWLDEARVASAVGPADRAALEHLCARLPELLPERPACLVHGDLWAGNVLATADGAPALIDPAVSYTWAEVDLAHLWTTAAPPESAVFFERYAELTGLDDGWRARMPIVQLRQHLAVIAQFDDDWGAADAVHATLAPFRTLG